MDSSQQHDCWFFYNSFCTKGDDCAFRHEPSAIGRPVCDQWKSGSCKKETCHFRHPEMPKAPANCFFENQPTGCLNITCQFNHTKPRPLLTSFNPLSPQLCNVPYPARFPPNSQMLGNTFLNASIITTPQQNLQAALRHQHAAFTTPRGARAEIFLNNQGFQNIRMNLFNQNNTSLGIVNPTSAGQQNLFKPSSLTNNLADAPTSNMQPISSSTSMTRPNTGKGLLPFPPLPFPFHLGGLFQSKNLGSPEQVSEKQKRRQYSSAKNAYKRTVKKYEGIKRWKSEKEAKHRNEKRTTEEANIERKKRKEKRSKTLKEKSRKLKQGRGLSKSKRSGGDAHHSETEDNGEDEEDTFEEINLGFEIKSLEEILREKALKKFLERQNKKNAAETSNSEGEIQPGDKSGTTSSEPTEVRSTEMIYSIDEILKSTETSTVETVKPKVKKLPPLKPLKPLKPLRNNKRKSLDTEKLADKAEKKKDCNQKKPLPPLKRLKPLSRTTQKGNSSANVLKRKLEQTTTDDVPVVRGKKLQRLKTTSVGHNPSFEDAACQTPTKETADISVASSAKLSSTKKVASSTSNLSKAKCKQKRTIVMLQSRTRSEPVKLKPVQRLKKDGNNTLLELSGPNIVKEGKKSQIDEQLKEENSKQVAQELQKVDSTAKVLPDKIVFDGNMKPAEKIKPLSTSQDANSTMLNSDFQSKTDDAVINKFTGPPASSVKSETSSAVEKIKKQGLNKDVDQSLQQESNEKVNGAKAVAQLNRKPVRMIKLNRDRLTTVKNYEGKSRILSNALGRKMKVNRAKPLPQKQAIVKPVSIRSTNILEQKQDINESEKLNTSGHIRQKHEVKSASSTSHKAIPSSGGISLSPEKKISVSLNDKIGNQTRLETVSVKPRTSEETNLQTRNNESFAKKTGLSRIFVKKTDNANQDHLAEKLNEKVDPVIATTKESTQQVINKDVDSHVMSASMPEKQQVPEQRKIDKVSSDKNKKTTLDQLMEEVSEDVEDEGEDFLNEALEKALAELSPVNTDDEEDVSNADDLLLEIEEMINS